MHLTQYALGLICLLLASLANALFCPTNFNLINMGDTLEQVQQVCGKADSEKKYKTPAPDNTPQEWTYYVKPDPSKNVTLKLTITFANGKVTYISNNGVGIASTSLCGSTIHVGNTPNIIESACGKASFINKSAPTSNAATPAEVETVELHYNSSPPVTLIFQAGKLTQKM